MQKSIPYQQKSHQPQSTWRQYTQESTPNKQLFQPQPFLGTDVPKLVQYPLSSTYRLEALTHQSNQNISTSQATGTEENYMEYSVDLGHQKMEYNPNQIRNFHSRPMHWKKREIYKDNRTIRKRRNNYFKKILIPKNAVSTLQKLHPYLKMTLTKEKSGNQMLFQTEIEIDGKTYNGSGSSEETSKESGSDNAIKAILIDKLEKIDENAARNKNLDDEEAINKISPEEDVEIISNQTDDNDTKSDEVFEDDNESWKLLASYAIYKLISDWQSPGSNDSDSIDSTMQSLAKAFPDAIPKKHPVQLLHEIIPKCQFSETREGSSPNLVFTYSITIEGQTFSGSGRNKKLAKKECAKNALDGLGIKYICP